MYKGNIGCNQEKGRLKKIKFPKKSKMMDKRWGIYAKK